MMMNYYTKNRSLCSLLRLTITSFLLLFVESSKHQNPQQDQHLLLRRVEEFEFTNENIVLTSGKGSGTSTTTTSSSSTTTTTTTRHLASSTTSSNPFYYYVTTEEAILGAPNRSAAMQNPLKGLMGNQRWTAASKWPKSIPNSLVIVKFGLDELLMDDPDVVGPENAFNWTALEHELDKANSNGYHLVIHSFISWIGQPIRLPNYLIDAGVELYYYAERDTMVPLFGDPILTNALEKFVRAFGAKYDGDRRIGFIQLGLIGFWGEWHTFDEYWITPNATQDFLGQVYDESFDQTKLITRYPNPDGLARNFGLHDSSYAHDSIDATMDSQTNGGVEVWYFTWPELVKYNGFDFWKRGPMGGETRPETYHVFDPTIYPVGTYNHQDFNRCTRVFHTTYMGHHNAFKGGEGYKGLELENALYAHALMGYNYIISKIALAISGTEEVDIDVTVRQIGVAPFYYDLDLNLDCPELSQPQTITGIQEIVMPGEIRTYRFFNIPATSECLGQVSFTLTSSYAIEGRPILFAQGHDGTVELSLPLPPSVEDRL